MQAVLAVLVAAATVVSGLPPHNERIIGGTVTTIDRYPFAAPLLFSNDLVYYTQSCAGTILTTRSILSVAHCFYGHSVNKWRIRVGSTYANNGGTVYGVSAIIIHSNFNTATLDNDVAILRTSNTISYINNAVQPASIAGGNYNLADNQVVYAIGWGATSINGPGSEQLRQVQIWSVNQATCKSRYAELGWNVTDNMLCSGWLDVGNRDQCNGDSGGPLLHNNVVVGVCSWGYQCAVPRYPGVNTRVSRFTTWIQNNA